MKKQLVSLLAIPIITISGCTGTYNDQIRIPGNIIYKGKINQEEVRLYTNLFRNVMYGADILEVTKQDGSKTTYIGSSYYLSPQLDFVKEKNGKRSKSTD